MKEKIKKKHSISRKLTVRIAAWLLVALILIYTASFFVVSFLVYNANARISSVIASIFGDLVLEEAHKEGVIITQETADIAVRITDYICKWYKVDYAYIYIPDFENGTRTYIAASQREGLPAEEFENHLIGYTSKYEMTEGEKAIWDHEQPITSVTTDNKFGHEIGTLYCVEDSWGSKFIAGVDISIKTTYVEVLKVFSMFAALILVIIIGFNVALYFILKKRVSEPAKAISDSMQRFITDGKRSSVALPEQSYSEYDMIASSFNSMTGDIDSYLENIRSLTKEQEHRNTELDIAARIQKGLLPKEHLVSRFYEMRTEMKPAKNVGGDLYYYIPLDENRVLTVIADVSGKGIGASIFMAITLMLIRQFAKKDCQPDEILRNVNNTLSENNSEMLFTTAFLGVYDAKEKTYTYSNAGHNVPYVVGDGITPLDGARGTLLGLYSGEEYTSTTVRLKAGDTVFMYTDGVTESVSADKRFFGTDRLEELLRDFRASHGDDLVSYIGDAVAKHSEGAEQFDDITMLALTVKDTIELSLDVDIRELTKIRDTIMSLPLTRKQQLDFCLSAEECFANICSYAFEDGVPDGEKVLCTVSISDRIVIRFEDGGMPFDPSKNIASPDDYDIDTQIGGLGRFIAFSNADDVDYEYKNGKNILTLTKYFEEENKDDNNQN